jgi:hypothetical protein
LQGTNQQIKAHEASSAVQHVNLLKEWSNSLEKKVGWGLLASVRFIMLQTIYRVNLFCNYPWFLNERVIVKR